MSTDQAATKPLSITDEMKRDIAEIGHTDPELGKILQSFGDKIAARAQNEPPEAKPPTKIIQLPLWPEPVRGAPNTVLRSALFAAIHSKKRRELGLKTRPEKPAEAIIIAAQNGDTIKYAGTQLNQYDADVFFEALHRARLHPLETECFFRGYDFLKAIGRQHGNREYEDLNDSLTRLSDGRVVIEWTINGRHYIFTGHLISSYIREKNTKLYKVTFAKEIRNLFAPACWTQLEWEERMALKGKPLAQWLHSFYSSHVPTAFPISAAYLHDKTGSPHALLKNFRVDLKHALVTLEDKLGWKATWNGDLLILKRPPTISQARHLRRTKPGSKTLPKPKNAKRLTSLDGLFSGTN